MQYEKISDEIERIPGVVAQGLLPLLTEGKDVNLIIAEAGGAVKELDRAAIQAAAAAAAGAAGTAAATAGSSERERESGSS